jgi:IS30 family transposase
MAYKKLTDKERYQIEALKYVGFTQTATAKKVGKSPRTVNSELKCNSVNKGYRGSLAIKRTDRQRRGAKKTFPSVWCHV